MAQRVVFSRSSSVDQLSDWSAGQLQRDGVEPSAFGNNLSPDGEGGFDSTLLQIDMGATSFFSRGFAGIATLRSITVPWPAKVTY